jgi:hypothetical protein
LNAFPDPLNIVTTELIMEGKTRREVGNLWASAASGEQNDATELYVIRATFVFTVLKDAILSAGAGRRAADYLDQISNQHNDSQLHACISYVASLKPRDDRRLYLVVLGRHIVRLFSEHNPGFDRIYSETFPEWDALKRKEGVSLS